MKKPGYIDCLRLEATLTGPDLGEVTVRGSAVYAFALRLRSYGLSGSLRLRLASRTERNGPDLDPLYAGFLKPGLLTLTLKLQAVQTDEEDAPEPAPLTVQAQVLTRVVREVRFHDADPAIGERHYLLTFLDAAARRWKSHHPLALFPSQTVGAALDAERGLVGLDQDWAELGTERPFVFLGLPPESKASFYDFVCWYADSRGGVFTYDYRSARYRLGGVLPPPPPPIALDTQGVAAQRWVLPPLPRYKPVICNGDTHSAARTEVDAPLAVDGIRQDHLLHTPLPKGETVTARLAQEKSRLRVPKPRLQLRLHRFPLLPFYPGDVMTVGKKDAGPKWRVAWVSLRGRLLADQPEARQGQYRLRLCTELRDLAEVPAPPKYRAPAYPQIVEGVVFSEVGRDDEHTYQSREAADGDGQPADFYRVHVPVFAGAGPAEVQVPFAPHHLPGQFYIPAAKGARVRLLLGLHAAAIERFCDFHTDADRDQAAQRHQLLLGKNAASSTALRLDYEDEQPVFQILRRNAQDRGTVRLAEGKMTLSLRAAAEGE